MKPLRVDIEIPPYLCRSIEQGVFYCSSDIRDSHVDRVSRRGIELTLCDDADEEQVRTAVSTWIRDTVERTLVPEPKVVRQWQVPAQGSNPRAPLSSPEAIMAAPWLREVGAGLLAFGPEGVVVLEGVSHACRALGTACGARPLRFPAAMPLATAQRCDCLRHFPQLLSMVSHLREDYAVLDAYSRRSGSAALATNCSPAPHEVSPADKVLRPALCYQVYDHFAGTRLDADPRLFSTEGACFRYESRNLRCPDRLFEFRMAEIVALGTQETLLSWRDDMMNQVETLVTKLGLPGRIQRENDPFFVDYAVMKSTFQQAHDLKYELQVPFPNADGHLAVASFNCHQDFFGRRFDISDRSGAPAWTTCTAFGVDRLVVSLVAHHGADVTTWPRGVRSLLDLA